jgi:protein SCO1/2
MTFQISNQRFLTRSLLVIITVFSVMACSNQNIKFNNVDITGSKAFGKDFSLTDHHGKKRELSEFKGQLVVMFYGYTQCPDVCPTTMTEMQGVMELLGKDASRVQVMFVTVDPERDTQELLSQYVPSFDKRFLGLRPQSEEELEKITKDFKVFYKKVRQLSSLPDEILIKPALVAGFQFIIVGVMDKIQAVFETVCSSGQNSGYIF